MFKNSLVQIYANNSIYANYSRIVSHHSLSFFTDVVICGVFDFSPSPIISLTPNLHVESIKKQLESKGKLSEKQMGSLNKIYKRYTKKKECCYNLLQFNCCDDVKYVLIYSVWEMIIKKRKIVWLN